MLEIHIHVKLYYARLTLRENKTQITHERESGIKGFSMDLAMGPNLDRKHDEEEQEENRVPEVNCRSWELHAVLQSDSKLLSGFR